MKLFITYSIWNVFSFYMMGIDKYNSIHHKYRISENFISLVALLMGAVGCITGALAFRHKTSKLKFRILFPFALFLNVFMLIYMLRYYAL